MNPVVLLWRDPRYSSLYFPGATSPVYPGLPNKPLRGKVVLSHTEYPILSFIFGFSQNQIFQYPLLISTRRLKGGRTVTLRNRFFIVLCNFFYKKTTNKFYYIIAIDLGQQFTTFLFAVAALFFLQYKKLKCYFYCDFLSLLK